ncbi:MAG: 50S ribosomal protein L23 [Candidatus Marinimicrobia bacterium]|nr:50S ribosomal protein L23 [Candidatus Neomarinimicrobiota bacterium]
MGKIGEKLNLRKKQIIQKPILTEKITTLSDTQNKYAFQVDRRSNKIQIKKAIEERFDVKVEKVAVINQIGKNKELTIRSGGKVIRTSGNTSRKKKAIVTVRKDQKIDLFDSDLAT